MRAPIVAANAEAIALSTQIDTQDIDIIINQVTDYSYSLRIESLQNLQH